MLKNKKGYFLVETVIALTIVATAITVVYVNAMSNYVKQNTQLTKYNTTQGLYSIKEVKKYLESDEGSFKSLVLKTENKYIDIFNEKNLSEDKFIGALNIKQIYFMEYDMEKFINNSSIAPSIKRELKSLSIDKNKCDYRYFVIFKDGSYSTIGIDCNS